MDSEQVQAGAQPPGAPPELTARPGADEIQKAKEAKVSFSLPEGMSPQAVTRFQDHVRNYGLEVLREATRIEDSRRLKGESLPEITASVVSEAAKSPKVFDHEPKKGQPTWTKVASTLTGIAAGAFGSYLLNSGWNWVGLIGLAVVTGLIVFAADFKFKFEFRRRDQ
ncbi:hypothetical protein OG205_34670 [Lentzea sp. NBC_00516]|uniref:hypothetical protein n=1 Tax=Lentzea sp. NBC_00516 TaxID=2903582 RepID=UPI002E80B372|nr:hypothetical protein [Lentzea sp. NBC_00516]WUD23172.1 hypothetical protein OG205_34670 [Lentzea sp. NBC_00516]